MAYIDNSVHLDIHISLSGVDSFNKLYYSAGDFVSGLTSGAFLAAWEAQCKDDLVALLNPAATLVKVVAAVYQLPTSGNSPPNTAIYNEAGGATGSEPMPPFATIRVIKVPDNSLAEPSGQQPFRNGRISFMGSGEGNQSGGLITSSSRTAWRAFAETLESVTVGSDVFSLMFVRPADTLAGGNPDTRCPVLETDVSQVIGTQNSRKF